MYYLCSENKGADQLRGYREADLRLCFRICKNRFSDVGANIYVGLRGLIYMGLLHARLSSLFQGRGQNHPIDIRNRNKRKENIDTRKTILSHQRAVMVMRTQRRGEKPENKRNENIKSRKARMTLVKVIQNRNIGNVRSINKGGVNRVRSRTVTLTNPLIVKGRENIKENIRRSTRENIRKDKRKLHLNHSDSLQLSNTRIHMSSLMKKTCFLHMRKQKHRSAARSAARYRTAD